MTEQRPTKQEVFRKVAPLLRRLIDEELARRAAAEKQGEAA